MTFVFMKNKTFENSCEVLPVDNLFEKIFNEYVNNDYLAVNEI